MGPHRLMLVDDEKNVLNALRRVLSGPQREVECYSDPEEALRRAQVTNFDIFISDFRMPRVDGAALLGQMRGLQPEAVRMIISAYADFEAVVASLNKGGIERFIAKPWNDQELRLAVDSALEKRDLMIENRRLAEQLREANVVMARQHEELARLERENPGLTQVKWAKDGSILLDDDRV